MKFKEVVIYTTVKVRTNEGMYLRKMIAFCTSNHCKFMVWPKAYIEIDFTDKEGKLEKFQTEFPELFPELMMPETRILE